MKEHSSKPITFEHVGKNYFEIAINNGEPVMLERSECRELLEMIDSTIGV